MYFLLKFFTQNALIDKNIDILKMSFDIDIFMKVVIDIDIFKNVISIFLKSVDISIIDMSYRYIEHP